MKIKRVRYNRKKLFLGLFLFLLVAGLTFGYALVTTKLSIEGVATVKDAKWDIHFDNLTPTTGSVSPTSSPVVTNTNVTFSAKLEDPGDFYGFTIDVENEGTINAAISTFSVTPDFSTIDYIDSTIEYSDGSSIQIGDILAAGKTKTIKVLLEYKDGINEDLYPTTDQSLTVTVSLGYEQYIGHIPVFTLPSGKTANTLTLGDELCVDDQCFNFIRYDGNNVVMLAEYNLKVGNILDSSWEKVGEYSNEDDGYGLQSSDVLGYVSGVTTNGFSGTVAFSDSDYWSDESSSYPMDVYDPVNHAGAPGTSNYSIAYYVEQYKTKLINDYGVTLSSIRLANQTDINTVGWTSGSLIPITSENSFILNTSFWMGWSYGEDYVGQVTSYGNYVNINTDYYCFYDTSYGVRPVLVVAKNEL